MPRFVTESRKAKTTDQVNDSLRRPLSRPAGAAQDDDEDDEDEDDDEDDGESLPPIGGPSPNRRGSI